MYQEIVDDLVETRCSSAKNGELILFESDELNMIFQAELEKGNEVVEETSWPPKCKKLVILKNRFQISYEIDNVDYRKIQDPHYWDSEYSTYDKTEYLVCK